MAKTTSFKVETWNKGTKKVRVFVLRKKGKLISWSYVKGSKLTKQQAREILNEYGTLKTTKVKKKDEKTGKVVKEKQRIKKKRTKLTNFTETVETVKSTIENRSKNPLIDKPKGKIVQYVVEGTYNKKTIVARSQKMGSPLAKDASQAKSEAWTSFLERLAKASGIDYDADEGAKIIDDVSNIREGWVRYD